jgi:hypothetical protein
VTKQSQAWWRKKADKRKGSHPSPNIQGARERRYDTIGKSWDYRTGFDPGTVNKHIL